MNLRDSSICEWPQSPASLSPNNYAGKAPVTFWLITSDPGLCESCTRETAQLSDLACTGCYAKAKDALRLINNRRPPEILVLEVNLNDPDEIRTLDLICQRAPTAKVIVLAGTVDRHSVLEAFLAGAQGYLLIETPLPEIIEGIREVHRGDVCMSPRVATLAVDLLRNGSDSALRPVYRLTRRERLHLGLLARGLSKKEIADKLSISFHTVDTHLRSIYRKMKVNTRSAAVAKAVQERLC